TIRGMLAVRTNGELKQLLALLPMSSRTIVTIGRGIAAGSLRNCAPPISLAPAMSRQDKSPANGRASFVSSAWQRRLLRGRSLGHVALERLVGLLREVRVEFTELGRLRDKALIGGLDVVALHFEGLVERLCTDELLSRCGAVFKDLLGVLGHLDGDRLKTLRPSAERLERRIHVVLTELLHVLDILHHNVPFPAGSAAYQLRQSHRGPPADWPTAFAIYCIAQKCQGAYCDAKTCPKPGPSGWGCLTLWQSACPSVIGRA